MVLEGGRFEGGLFAYGYFRVPVDSPYAKQQAVRKMLFYPNFRRYSEGKVETTRTRSRMTDSQRFFFLASHLGLNRKQIVPESGGESSQGRI